MDLFHITCTTCKSRLKVRDRAVIGQILACPKCGGMVMIKPPPSWSDDGPSKSDLTTATDVMQRAAPAQLTVSSTAFEAVEDLLSDAPPKMTPPAGAMDAFEPLPTPAAGRPRFVGGPQRPPPPPPPAAAGKGPEPAPQVAAAAPSSEPSAAPPAGGRPNGSAAAPAKAPVAAASPPALTKPPVATAAGPRADEAAPASGANEADLPPATAPAVGRNWRFAALMAGTVIGGMVLAFLAVTTVIHLLRDNRTVVTTARPATSDLPPAVPPAQPAPENGASAPAVLPSAADAAPVGPDSPARPPDSAAVDANLSSGPPNGSASASALPSTPTPAPASQPPGSATPSGAADAPPAQPSTTLAASDPAGIAQPAAAPSSTLPAADPLARFDRLIGGGVEDPLASSTPAPAPPAAPLPAADSAGRPALPRPPPREVDVARRLADPLVALESTATPLADFLQVVSDLSTIPITLEPDPLPLVRASASTPVAVKVANTTVGDALAAALRPLKLEHVILDGQLVVRLAEPATPATIEVQARDLAAGEEELTALAELLQAVVEPRSWGEASDSNAIEIDAEKNVLRVRHRRAVQAQILLACDKLRGARGKAPVLKLDPAVLSLDSRSARAKARLETPVSLNYSHPARLVTLLDRLGEAAGVRLIVDWRDAATVGWHPAAEATLVADKQPLAAALDALLAPMDLAWRVVDGQTIEVLTPARLADRVELEIYPVEGVATDAAAAERLLATLLESLGPASFRDGGGGGELRLDLSGRCLLAALPQPKQRELESLLATLARGKAPAGP